MKGRWQIILPVQYMYQYTVEALLMDTLVSRQLYLPPLSQNLDSV